MAAAPTGDVKAVFDSYPPKARKQLLAARALLLKTAAQTDGVGAIHETLKWSEPAYLTQQTGAGTTIRLAWKAVNPDKYRVLVHCQTNLIETFRTICPELNYDGNRAIVLDVNAPLPRDALAQFLGMALVYHRVKSKVVAG